MRARPKQLAVLGVLKAPRFEPVGRADRIQQIVQRRAHCPDVPGAGERPAEPLKRGDDPLPALQNSLKPVRIFFFRASRFVFKRIAQERPPASRFEPSAAVDARGEHVIFQPVQIASVNPGFGSRQQLRLDAPDDGVMPPAHRHRLERGSDEFDERMMMDDGFPVEEERNAVIGKRLLDQVAVFGQIAHHDRDVAPAEPVLLHAAQDVPRGGVDFGAPVRRGADHDAAVRMLRIQPRLRHGHRRQGAVMALQMREHRAVRPAGSRLRPQHDRFLHGHAREFRQLAKLYVRLGRRPEQIEFGRLFARTVWPVEGQRDGHTPCAADQRLQRGVFGRRETVEAIDPDFGRRKAAAAESPRQVRQAVFRVQIAAGKRAFQFGVQQPDIVQLPREQPVRRRQPGVFGNPVKAFRRYAVPFHFGQQLVQPVDEAVLPRAVREQAQSVGVAVDQFEQQHVFAVLADRDERRSARLLHDAEGEAPEAERLRPHRAGQTGRSEERIFGCECRLLGHEQDERRSVGRFRQPGAHFVQTAARLARSRAAEHESQLHGDSPQSSILLF
jgi:hypothetical protein